MFSEADVWGFRARGHFTLRLLTGITFKVRQVNSSLLVLMNRTKLTASLLSSLRPFFHL